MSDTETKVTKVISESEHRDITVDEWRQEWSADKLYLAVMTMRPNAHLFVTQLEFKHYPPQTDKNDLFDFWCILWEGIPWAVVGIPEQDRHLADEVAAEAGLRIANGVPHLITGEGTITFPYDYRNVMTMENTPESRAYDGAEAQKEMEKEEEAKVQDIYEKHRQFLLGRN